MKEEQIYISDYTGDDTIPSFVTFCIEQYKHYKGIERRETSEEDKVFSLPTTAV